MNAITAYEVLGVSIEDDLIAIQKAYRRRLREFHPDSTGQNDYEDFLWIKKAFDILRSPEKRKKLGDFVYFPSHLKDLSVPIEHTRINIYA